MSRIDYNWDEDYPGQFELQRANHARALAGRKGQAVLRELEAALVELPDKRLVSGVFAEGGEVCATGAMQLRRLMLAGMTREQATAEVERQARHQDDWRDAGCFLGISPSLAWSIVEENDEETSRLDPEGRYLAVLAWVRRQLKEQP